MFPVQLVAAVDLGDGPEVGKKGKSILAKWMKKELGIKVKPAC